MKYSSNDPISNLHMSTRLYNALRRNGIHTIGSFIELSEEQLNVKLNIGKKSIDEYRRVKQQLELLDNQITPVLEKDYGENANSVRSIEKTNDSTLIMAKGNSFSSIHITVTHNRETHYFDGDLSLENLAKITGMSIRTLNFLKRANINLTSEVVRLSNDDLIAIRNMGVYSCNEILKIIAGIQIF